MYVFQTGNEVKYEFVWFTGDQLPSSINEVISDDENNENNIDENMCNDEIDISVDEEI